MKYLEEIPKFFQKIFEIQKSRSKKIVYGVSIFLLVSFVLGIVSGVYVGIYQPEFVSQTLSKFGQNFRPIFSLIQNREFALVVIAIFLNNLRVAFVITLSGFTFFLTFLLLLLIGVITGFFIGISGPSISANFNFSNLFGLAFVGSMEFIAITLAAIEGLYLGISLFFPDRLYKGKISRKDSLMRTIKQTAYVYVLIIIILAVAAIVETIFIFSEVHQAPQSISQAITIPG